MQLHHLALLQILRLATHVSVVGAQNANGPMRLIGTSFGRPGYNATFDYIARSLCNCEL